MAPSYGFHRALQKAKQSVMHWRTDTGLCLCATGTDTGTDASAETSTEASMAKRGDAPSSTRVDSGLHVSSTYM